MLDTQAWIERLVADPTVQKPEILYIRKLRSLAAEGSTGDGAVVATVNGYGALTKIRIAPEAMGDLPRLERLVLEAVNLATDEAERTRPPPPLFPPRIGGDPTEWPIESPKPRAAKSPPEPVVCNMELGERGYLPTDEEPGRTAFRDAAAPIRLQIYRDMLRQPEELHSLFWIVAMHLGDRGLTAAFARRMMQYKDPKVLRRFRREVGLSLTEYIQRRQRQLAAKMYYRSGLPRGDIADLLGYAGEEALARAVEENDLDAFCDNVESIRSWIRRDGHRVPYDLHLLLYLVEWDIHRPSLTAASARRFAEKFTDVDGPEMLRRFRRAAGISLTEYIRRRRIELAARMIYISDLPVEDVAERLGFADGEAVRRTVGEWAGRSLEELRDRWEDRGIDHVVWERVKSGEARKRDLEQHHYESRRLRVSLELLAEREKSAPASVRRRREDPREWRQDRSP